MQQIKIPQSQFITNNGMVAGEWLVFLNELIRLSNQIISKDTLNKADNAEFNSIEQSFVSFDTDNDIIESVAITVTDDDTIELVSIYQPDDADIVNTQISQDVDETIEYASINTGSDDAIENIPIVLNQDEISFSSPEAQLSAIEKQFYDEVIWSLTV